MHVILFGISLLTLCVACAGHAPGDASDKIAELIAIVESGEIQESELAIRALAKMGSKATPAIAAISKKLGHPTHAIRSAAADALVAIGEKCVVPLRKLLNSPEAKTRASATHVLSRLKRLDLNDLAKLTKDSDPRVRAATANPLSTLGNPGVPLLADMLQDPDLAVSVEAARGLQSNRKDASIAVPRLIKALSRADLSWTAAEALSAYGIKAQQAIPALVKAFPDGAGKLLQHIGPPNVRDISLLCENLSHDEKAKMVVAECLAGLGLDGKAAADALEAVAEASFKECMRLEGLRKSRQSRRSDNAGHVCLCLAGETCAAAMWNVTQDTPRFLRLIERQAIAIDSPIFDYYCREAILTAPSAGECRLIDKMLRHANVNVQKTALAVLKDAGPKGGRLKSTVLELAQGRDAELSRKAIDVLANMGPTAGKDSAPVLLTKLQDGTLPLRQFANAAGQMDIRSADVQATLERGLRDKEQWTAVACAGALCNTSKEPRRTARLIMEAAREGCFTDRNAIESLNGLKSAEDVVVPYLVEQLRNTDYWTRHDAINALGNFGRKASQATAPLKKLLDDESPLIRLKAAKAVFLISGKATDLEKQLDAAFASDAYADRHGAIKTVAELKHSGGKFVRYALTELRRSPPILSEEAIAALQAIGTEEAVAALRTTAESSDWLLRSQAAKALEQIRNPDGKGGK